MSSQPVAPETEVGVDGLFAELVAKIREFRPKDDLSAIEKAYQFASAHHSRQKRDSGEPYMNHPLLVAHTLADMRMDLVCIGRGRRICSPRRRQRVFGGLEAHTIRAAG